MSVIRSFIAVDLPQTLYEQLDVASSQLQEMLVGQPVRWVPAQNIHLTLKFLGDVSEKNIRMINAIIENEAASHKYFEISVGDFGVFPNFARPRVIWVGVQAPDELINLQRRIDIETARLGYAPDQRVFNPHLTFGRVSRNATPKNIRRVSEILKGHKIAFLGAARICAVHLYRSDLRRTGAVYSKMFSAPLSEN